MKTYVLAVLLGGVLAGGWPAAAVELPDPYICTTQDGFVEVAKGWLLGVVAARDSGQITEEDFTNLAVWWTQMKNWMLETDKVKETCEALLQSRRDFGF